MTTRPPLAANTARDTRGVARWKAAPASKRTPSVLVSPRGARAVPHSTEEPSRTTTRRVAGSGSFVCPPLCSAFGGGRPSRMTHHGTPCGGSLSVPWCHSTACSPRAPSLLNHTTAPPRRQGRCKCPSGTLASVSVPWSCGTPANSPALRPHGTAVPCGYAVRAAPAQGARAVPPSRHRFTRNGRVPCGHPSPKATRAGVGMRHCGAAGNAHCGARAGRQTRWTAHSGTVHPSASIPPQPPL
jgi:hypothetical protein